MIRTLIVDDEEPARAKLAGFLAREDTIEVIGIACDGHQAVAAIADLEPDLVFLDIQMPRLGGLEVVRQVTYQAMPWVVFVTAYDEHALAAFELQAIDYLLKPYARDRLQEAVARVSERMATEAHAARAEQLDTLLKATEPKPEFLEQILVNKAIHREILLPLSEVNLIQAQGNYVNLQTADRTYQCRGPLSKLAARLDPGLFLPINRSEIVRLAAVLEFQPWFRGDYRVVMRTGAVLNWSRRYRKTQQAQHLLGKL